MKKREITGKETWMEKEKPYQLWLANVPGVGVKTMGKLLREFGSAEAVYGASDRELDKCLNKRLGKQSELKPAADIMASNTLSEKTSEADMPPLNNMVSKIQASKESWEIFPEYEKLMRRKIKFTCYGDEDYPERLKDIPDPPYILYYQGRLPSDRLPAVAIIGARECSEYGSYAAKEFGSKLAAAGIQIISGLAIGIDGLSQEAALSAGGESFGVLGCGVDICYPKRNRFLYERLKKNGGILSEYAPGTEPKANLFPPRNRIISGLSDAVLVVEAREKSGTLITVDMALEQGREVFAVPGRVTDALSAGCHKLLRQGAGIAASPDDILEALYGVGTQQGNRQGKRQPASGNPAAFRNEQGKQSPTAGNRIAFNIEETGALSPEEKQLLKHLDTFSKSPEEILKETDGSMTIQEIMWVLVELCMKGLAEQGEAGRFRQKKSCILKNFSV